MTNKFGGNWTKKKLEILEKYIKAYLTIIEKYPFFKKIYIDAFAGTGFISNEKYIKEKQLFQEEEINYIKGSVSIILDLDKKFDAYYFIEKDKNNFLELENNIKENYPKLLNRITLFNNDANEKIKELCNVIDWKKSRALLFLDPFGMQLEWKTLEIVSQTNAIDVWILFPLGLLNRLLSKDGKRIVGEEKLNNIFGTKNWKDKFYKVVPYQFDLFDSNKDKLEKIAKFDSILNYFVERLGTIFRGVVKKPIKLYNTKNNPIFSFCFAASNEKGSKIAVKIANDIMRKMEIEKL